MARNKQEKLANGLEIIFEDQSNRYFGDYHRICVIATIRCPVALLEDQDLKTRAADLYGDHLDVKKSFERMGVSSADVEEVRSALIENFLQHAADYMSRPDYPQLLVASELKKKKSNRFYA